MILGVNRRNLTDRGVHFGCEGWNLFSDEEVEVGTAYYEPTSGVSTRDKARIMETITTEVRNGGVTAAVIEHDMDIVFQYADRIVVMADGRILADGTPDEIRGNKGGNKGGNKDVEAVFLGST